MLSLILMAAMGAVNDTPASVPPSAARVANRAFSPATNQAYYAAPATTSYYQPQYYGAPRRASRAAVTPTAARRTKMSSICSSLARQCRRVRRVHRVRRAPSASTRILARRRCRAARIFLPLHVRDFAFEEGRRGLPIENGE